MVKWLLGGVIVLAMLAAETGGRESRESLVEAYLTALQAGDAEAMLSLVGPNVDARVAVADEIQRDGGKELKNVTVRYLEEFGSSMMVAVNGVFAGDGSTFVTTIPMSRENGRYYLSLGQGTPTGNESDTSSPSAIP
jgi:hypothetical protein